MGPVKVSRQAPGAKQMISTRCVVFLRNASQIDTMLGVHGLRTINRWVRRLRCHRDGDGCVLRSVARRACSHFANQDCGAKHQQNPRCGGNHVQGHILSGTVLVGMPCG